MNEYEYQLQKVGDPPRVSLKEAFRKLYDNFSLQLMAAHYMNGAPKARNSNPLEKGKTRRGATHQVNPTFQSRQLLAVTPAEYRRQHMGAR